ncbi:DUF2142 domain-containing protein [Vagococcus fluvialis]|uniref:DUF2142 domain-containing protein n=1 Tax=Vagococcus fluvialis TaxID=2738 RepID=UPI003B5A9AAA
MESVLNVFNEKIFDRKKYYFYIFLFVAFISTAEKSFVGIPKKAIIFMSVISFFIVFCWSKSIEKNTFVISLVFGILFSLMSPVFDVWDEPAHFTRVQYISEGHLYLTNNKEDHVVSKDEKWLEEKSKFDSKDKDALPNIFEMKLWEEKHDKETEYNKLVPVTNSYGTIAYFPSLLGYEVGKVLTNGNLGVMFYLGRIFNAIFYSLCAFIGVKLAGKWKNIFSFFALQPVILYAAGSFNQDAFSYGIMLVVVGLFFKMIQNSEERITYQDLIIYILLCALLAYTKLPYIVLAGLVFFIPYKKFADKKMFITMLSGIVFVIIISGLWFLSYSKIEGLPSRYEDVDPGRQVEYILNNFKNFIGILFTGIYTTITKYGQLSSYGWDRKGSHVLAIINLIFIGIVPVFPMKDVEKVSKWTKFGVFVITFLISILIYLSMYLTWSNVGRQIIMGVQGRYFVGVLFLLPIMLNYSKVVGNITENKYTKYTPQVMALLLLIFAIASRIGIYY